MNNSFSQTSALDNEELVHEAVRQGHRISLEIYLNRNPQCVNRIYTYNRSKWTPLLAACYYKHEDIVRMLLRRFPVDIETKGTVIFDMTDSQPEMVEDVSPLWTATAVDHVEIVRLLVEQGQADVNSLTKSRSTCFRVACYNNNLSLAKYLIEHGANPYQMKIGNYTNLMLSAGRRYSTIVKYLVNELHSNINEQDENGQTALYYAIKSGSLEIVQYFLENGALNIRDKLRNVTPLMRAALYGEIELVQVFAGYCSDIDWIEGRELLGATFGGCVARFENFSKTTEYLTEAFQLRQAKNLPKIISSSSAPNELFQYRSECQTLDEFNQLVQSANEDDLRIETIRIHQRLLGDRSNDYHHVLRYYGAVLADKYRYDDCLRWWFYEIDLKHQHKIPLKKDYLRYFIDIFLEMKSNGISWSNFSQLLKIVDCELQTNPMDENWDHHLHTLLYVISIIARIIFTGNEQMNSQQRELIQVIQTIIQREYRTKKDEYSLLHLCSSTTTMKFSDELSYPCGLTVRLLLACGIHVDSLDINRNTPLHRLMQNTCSMDAIMIIGNLLCQFGAHLDQVNNHGEIALDLIPSTQQQIIRHWREKMAVRQLKCLCARLIRKQNLPSVEYF